LLVIPKHMVCDLVEWERMVQRLGRVNRRGGEGKLARIEVVAALPKEKQGAEPTERRLARLRAPLDKLPSRGRRRLHRLMSR
jgi:CRISPR-associated endonuclease/helicase Cas3